MIRSALLVLALSTFFLVMACGDKGDGAGGHEGKPHWGYEGDGGPEHWGGLDPDFSACEQGTKQSPIDIAGATEGDVPSLAFDYKPTKLTILNNGHSIQVNHDAGSTLTVDGEAYHLLQFHFHTPSEHTVGGNAYPMEMHLVHQHPKTKKLAVLGVLIERGEANAALAAVWAHLPLKPTPAKTVDGVTVEIAAALPAERSVYVYDGSLTTPPCTEGVHWFLLTTPITLSPEQVAAFQKAFQGNARPVQALNGRAVTRN